MKNARTWLIVAVVIVGIFVGVQLMTAQRQQGQSQPAQGQSQTSSQSQSQSGQSQSQNGRWTLNQGKSNISSGSAKEQSRTYEQQGTATKITVVGADAEGNRVAYDYTITPDGKAHPVVAALPNGADTVEVKQVDANTTETVFKKGGKVVETMRAETSKDGKQLTITAMRVGPNGEQVKDVLVFDKVAA
jgi:hypothetical protein